jgi:hypothetical protein
MKHSGTVPDLPALHPTSTAFDCINPGGRWAEQCIAEAGFPCATFSHQSDTGFITYDTAELTVYLFFHISRQPGEELPEWRFFRRFSVHISPVIKRILLTITGVM